MTTPEPPAPKLPDSPIWTHGLGSQPRRVTEHVGTNYLHSSSLMNSFGQRTSWSWQGNTPPMQLDCRGYFEVHFCDSQREGRSVDAYFPQRPSLACLHRTSTCQCFPHLGVFLHKEPRPQEGVCVMLSVTWFTASILVPTSLPSFVIPPVNGFSSSWRWGKISGHFCVQKMDPISISNFPCVW